jgi:ectoine hydroxylase-related dioxygenase (phytanoyl-CoA dioxygenase family)
MLLPTAATGRTLDLPKRIEQLGASFSPVLNRAARKDKPVTQPTITLTGGQIDFYHREGYLVLPRITTAEEVEWLRGVYDRLFASRAGRADGNQLDLAGPDDDTTEAKLPQILGPARYAPELKEGLFRANALAVAKQLLGEACIAQGEHAILKPARVGPETPWHQDEAYWGDEKDYNAISIWIPLQDATPENGCMWFIPGSHKGQIVPHHSIGHDVRVHGLEMDSPPPRERAVACPIPAGGCTIHHNRTMHYAGANTSDEPRRAYILAFGTPATDRATPGNFYWNKVKRPPREDRARAAEQRAAGAPGAPGAASATGSA